MYIRKTKDEFEIQGYYSDQYGWEMVTAEETWKAAKEMLKCYRDNEPGIPFRIKKVRVKKEVI
jgi:hypothetical protein